MKSDDISNYRIVQIRIKKSHALFQFCDNACFASKNLYNVGNFHIRQVFSGLQKEPEFRHQNEIEVLEKIEVQIEQVNAIKSNTFEKQKAKHALKAELFGKEESTRFNPPDKEKPFLGYNMLDGILKLTCQPDYVAMPGTGEPADVKAFVSELEKLLLRTKSLYARPVCLYRESQTAFVYLKAVELPGHRSAFLHERLFSQNVTAHYKLQPCKQY